MTKVFPTIRKTNGDGEGGTWYRNCRTNEEQQVRVQVLEKTDQAAETRLRLKRLVIEGSENLCWCTRMVSRKTATKGNHRPSIPVITAARGCDIVAITTWLFPDDLSSLVQNIEKTALAATLFILRMSLAEKDEL